MNQKDVLLDQIATCHDDLSWYPTFLNSIDGLSAEQATWKENESSHSIWQIVNHLAFWNEKWMRYSRGEEIFESIGNKNHMTFGDSGDAVSEENWQSAVKRLDSVYTEWRKVIEECPESKLDSLVPNYPGDDGLWWRIISNLCTHNAYHIGQVVFIRKQQGSWAG